MSTYVITLRVRDDSDAIARREVKRRLNEALRPLSRTLAHDAHPLYLNSIEVAEVVE